ncbi:MAG: ABC transporter permease [Sphaerochaetaceae bacterium]|jgi:ribose/xylose/arabinose/galactoside ABC-type transport system permease subunit|nr:ABC transporter permease [Sphaerochaetaceae bacterium]
MNKITFNITSTKELVRRYGTVFAAVLILIFFSLAARNFMTQRNMFMLLRQMSVLTIVSLGFTFVMAAGGFDMSLGNNIGLVSIVFAIVMTQSGSFLLGVAAALLVGIAIGSVNGFLVSYVGLPDFIGTFAIGTIVYGLKMLITKGNPMFFGADVSKVFLFLGQGYVGPVPFPVILMAVFAVVTAFVLGKTVFGRRVYAIGGNSVASLFAGIKTKRYRFITFVISGFSVAFAAIVMTSRIASAQPLAGEDQLLDAISVVFLSTTMFGEGEPTARGTVVAAFIITMLTNGLTMMNVPYYFQYITKGLVVILAVLTSVSLGQKQKV